MRKYDVAREQVQISFMKLRFSKEQGLSGSGHSGILTVVFRESLHRPHILL